MSKVDRFEEASERSVESFRMLEAALNASPELLSDFVQEALGGIDRLQKHPFWSKVEAVKAHIASMDSSDLLPFPRDQEDLRPVADVTRRAADELGSAVESIKQAHGELESMARSLEWLSVKPRQDD